MAKIPPSNFLMPGRGVSLNGVFYTRRTRKGFSVVKWPRKQPTPATALQADRQKLIALAARVTTYMTPQEQDFARKVAAVTKLLPRDFLMLALFQRIGTFIGRDGKKRYSVAAMQDVSDLLDALWQLKGGILVRDETWWTGLPAGVSGDLLQMGPDGLPIWSPAAGGGSGAGEFMAAFALRPQSAPATIGAGNFICNPIFPADDVTLSGINVMVAATGSGRKLVGGLYSDVAGTMTGGTLLAKSAGQVATTGLNQLTFQTPVDLNKNTFYWFGLAVYDGSGNLQTYTSDLTRNSYMYFAQSSASLPSTAPTSTPGTGATQFTWWAF